MTHRGRVAEDQRLVIIIRGTGGSKDAEAPWVMKEGRISCGGVNWMMGSAPMP
jgi:hypothetical protein